MKIDFPYSPPVGYSYEFEEFNTRLIIIWLRHSYPYTFNNGKSIKSVWGFYSPKKQQYFSPINSKKPGKVINISSTTAYTAMPVKQTSLENCFV